MAGGPAHDIISAATSVRCRRPGGEVLYETADDADLVALAAAMRTESPRGRLGHCMCLGTVLFLLDGATPETITLHHGVTLRWEGSEGNHVLSDPDAIMDWLSARGMGFVRDEYEESRRQAERDAADATRWQAAMPASLRPFFDEMRRTGADQDPRWTEAIMRELPDPVARGRVLLDLLGTASGPWNGFPSYEMVPVRLLLYLPLDELLAAVGGDPDQRRCEGAARFFASWAFREQRRKQLARLPPALRHRLIAHVVASGDPDKIVAVRKALVSG